MDSWYRQVDGVAMVSSLAVVLANLWVKKFEPQLCLEVNTIPSAEESEKCTICNEQVEDTACILCDSCNSWCHLNCTGLQGGDIDAMALRITTGSAKNV